MASTNLPGKLSRAVAQYLVTSGVAAADCVYTQNTRRPRTFANGPIVSVFALPGTPEPAMTGNDRFTLHLSIKGTAVNNPQDENDETERLAFDALVGAVRDAMMQSSSDNGRLDVTRSGINAAAATMPTAVDASAEAIALAQNNADMADFTLLALYDSTYGQGQAEDCDWEIVLQFSAACCESAITGYF